MTVPTTNEQPDYTKEGTLMTAPTFSSELIPSVIPASQVRRG